MRPSHLSSLPWTNSKLELPEILRRFFKALVNLISIGALANGSSAFAACLATDDAGDVLGPFDS